MKITKDANGVYDDRSELKSYKPINFVVPWFLSLQLDCSGPGCSAVSPPLAPPQQAPQGWAPQDQLDSRIVPSAASCPNPATPSRFAARRMVDGRQPQQAQPWDQPQRKAAPQEYSRLRSDRSLRFRLCRFAPRTRSRQHRSGARYYRVRFPPLLNSPLRSRLLKLLRSRRIQQLPLLKMLLLLRQSLGVNQIYTPTGSHTWDPLFFSMGGSLANYRHGDYISQMGVASSFHFGLRQRPGGIGRTGSRVGDSAIAWDLRKQANKSIRMDKIMKLQPINSIWTVAGLT